MEAFSLTSSSSCSGRKRGLGPPATATATPSTQLLQANCLVDGCAANLSGCREYHRRHRVCEFHSKSPVVTINGRTMRFCQQCSRFQSLSEFDNEKRSCRRRLDGHNRRRRKRQSAALPIISSPCLLEFGGPQTFSISNPTTNSIWTRSTDESGSREVSFTSTTTSRDPSDVVQFSTRTRSLEKQHFTLSRCFDDGAHSLLSVASQRSHHQTTDLEMGLCHVAHPQPEDLASPGLLFGYHSPMEINGDGGAKLVQYQLCGESSYLQPVDYR